MLDGIKGGLTIKPEVRKRDREEYDKEELPPARGGGSGYTTSALQSPRKRARRPPALGDDIIETLHKAGDKAQVSYFVLPFPYDAGPQCFPRSGCV